MTDAPQNDPAMPKMKQYAPIASLLTSRLTQYPDPRPTAMANTINNRSPLPTSDAAMSSDRGTNEVSSFTTSQRGQEGRRPSFSRPDDVLTSCAVPDRTVSSAPERSSPALNELPCNPMPTW
jgi:hypothetical protein